MSTAYDYQIEPTRQLRQRKRKGKYAEDYSKPDLPINTLEDARKMWHGVMQRREEEEAEPVCGCVIQ